jgi:hypothetical protein
MSLSLMGIEAHQHTRICLVSIHAYVLSAYTHMSCQHTRILQDSLILEPYHHPYRLSVPENPTPQLSPYLNSV